VPEVEGTDDGCEPMKRLNVDERMGKTIQLWLTGAPSRRTPRRLGCHQPWSCRDPGPSLHAETNHWLHRCTSSCLIPLPGPVCPPLFPCRCTLSLHSLLACCPLPVAAWPVACPMFPGAPLVCRYTHPSSVTVCAPLSAPSLVHCTGNPRVYNIVPIPSIVINILSLLASSQPTRLED
jgi:hypothetical protein